MTREEAIRRIKEHMIHHHMGEYPHIFIGEALDMAIDALMEKEEYEIQRQLKRFDIKDPRPKTVTKCNDLYDEDGGEILRQESLVNEKQATKNKRKKTSEWISVNEKLPERGAFVLLSYEKNCINPTQFAKNTMAVGRYDYGMFLVDGCKVSVTHWMPLPEPPKEEV